MITFRPKQYLEKNLIQDAIGYLDKKGLDFNIISAEESDDVSKINSRSMVITKFLQTDKGRFLIEVQDKEGYRYTEKLFKNFNMNILERDEKHRKLSAETNYLGIAYDAIEILARKYKLSLVK